MELFQRGYKMKIIVKILKFINKRLNKFNIWLNERFL